MLELDFPVFVDGQTLTHTELNDLRDFLDSQDTTLGRLIGFGVNCGLEVTIDGSDYVVQPGLAIDQHGRPIMLDESVRLPLSSDLSEFDWLPTGDGVTVTLRLEEETEDAPECEDDGCIGHASLTHRRPIVELAQGCLPPAAFTVDGSELASVNPITVTKGSRTSNTGTALTNALVGVLADRGLSAARSDLLETAIIETTDLPGIAAWKAAFLNQVYFATLELLRCEALTSITCIRTTETPGVALGCNDDGRWDCQRRHHWEPPAGLTTSLAGAECEDPCKHHRRRIEGIIDTFALPAVPPPDDPPTPGGGGPYIACHHPVTTGYGSIRDEIYTLSLPCLDFVVPPLVIDEIDPRFEYDPDILVDWATEGYTVDEFYPGTVDPVGVGTIGIGYALGVNPAEAEILIADAITGFDDTVPPTVLVVSETDVAGLDGYQPAVKAALTDEIVLVQDDMGKVVTTGRIPVNGTLNNIGPSLAASATNADNAVVVANEASAAAASAATGVADLNIRADGLDSILIGDATNSGIVDRISQVEGELSIQGAAVTQGHLNDRVDGAVNQLQTELAQVRAEVQDVVVTENNQFRLEMDQRWSRNDTRIDAVLQSGFQSRFESDRPNREMIDTFRNMSDVLARGVDDDNGPARAALREVERSVARLEAQADVSDDDLADVGGDEIVAVFEGMAEVARSSGATASSLGDLRRSINALRDSLG